MTEGQLANTQQKQTTVPHPYMYITEKKTPEGGHNAVQNSHRDTSVAEKALEAYNKLEI